MYYFMLSILKIIKELKYPYIFFDRVIFYFILFYDKKIQKNHWGVNHAKIYHTDQFIDIFLNKYQENKTKLVREKYEAEFLLLTKEFDGRKKILLNKIPKIFDADISLAKICYYLVRCQKPEIIVETGVANGATSNFILSAFKKNRCGLLHSIDLPPLSADQKIGQLVDEDLKNNWYLYKGSSLRLLSKIINKVKKIDLFLHDSANISTIQKFEVKKIYGSLNFKGIIIMNNIGTSNAFLELVEELKPEAYFIIEQIDKKQNYTGVIVK